MEVVEISQGLFDKFKSKETSFILQCRCESTNFTYDNARGYYICSDCGREYHEVEAGFYLVEKQDYKGGLNE